MLLELLGLPCQALPIWELARVGLRYLKIIWSSEMRSQCLLWGCPQICSSGAPVLLTRTALPICAWHSSPRLQWTPTATKKNRLSPWHPLSGHDFEWPLFHINTFPEGLQPSSEFSHHGTSCLRMADEECGNGCKGTCPFSFLFFFLLWLPFLENHRWTDVSNDCSATKDTVFSFKFSFKWFVHLGRRIKNNRKIKMFTLQTYNLSSFWTIAFAGSIWVSYMG